MSRIRDLAKSIRPLVRRRGWDVVPFPGSNHAHLRGRFLDRLGVDLVLDVGANTGQFGRNARQAGYAGRMISFEPMSAAFAQLERTASGDSQWVAVHAAVGAAPGELKINVAHNSISSSLLPMLDRHATIAPRSRYVGTETVRVERLDVLVDEAVSNARAPFLKVDTQGYEAFVLDGATGVLDRVVGVELELSLVPLYDGQMLWDGMIDRMKAAGFSLEVISPGLVDPERGETLQIDGLFRRT